MNRQGIDFVQSSINYQFKNLQLLEQAFTRKSYSEEHPEVQNNEVLEFYGDEILDFFVTKMMYKRFSRILNNELVSEKNEGELTKLKSILVSKESLARCMYNIGFSKFLYLGKSDEKNEVYKSKSVNEDLFEAIIGAVAADCDWNYENLEKSLPDNAGYGNNERLPCFACQGKISPAWIRRALLSPSRMADRQS